MASSCFKLLPQEILDSIIDCLYDDKPSLSQCTLVSQRFIDRSRHHLFFKVTLVNEGDSTSECTFDTIAFLSFLAEIPSIRHYIQRITIHNSNLDPDAPPGKPIQVSHLISILELLPQLIRLSLCDVRLASDESAVQRLPSLAARFKLKRLSLTGVDDESDNSRDSLPMVDLLSLFSHIDMLYVSGFYSDWANHVKFASLSHLAQKVSVSSVAMIALRDFTELEELLEATVDTSHVSRLAVTNSAPYNTPRINSILKLFSEEALREFEFDLRNFIWRRRPWDVLELSRFIFTRSVNVHVTISRFPSSNRSTWEYVTSLMSAFPTSFLEDISVHLHVDLSSEHRIPDYGVVEGEISVPDTLKFLDWSTFATILGTMPKLRKVIFHMHFHGFPVPSNYTAVKVFEASRVIIEDRLAIYHKCGVLRVKRELGIWTTFDA